MIKLSIGMLRIKRLESATNCADSDEMVLALEDVNGSVTNYDGFSSLSTDLRRRFIFNHEDLKLAHFALQSNSHWPFELDAARITQSF